MSDVPCGIRFAEGTKNCSLCGTKNNIIQFEQDEVVKGLPITKIAFICKDCALKKGLIKR